jgi:uncharacterized protein
MQTAPAERPDNEPPAADTLAAARYVSLATFRTSGRAVPTPVWCASDGGDFYFFSARSAGKVKRLRNSDRARLAVCDVRGRVSSGWAEAQAWIVEDQAGIERALAALHRKYGWQMWVADVGSRLTGRYRQRAYLRARLAEGP